MKYLELTPKQQEKFRQALIDGIVKKWEKSTPAVNDWLHPLLEEMQPNVPEEWRRGISEITWR